MKGTFLENCTWTEAEELFQNDPVIVIPLGAALKEHGPHLKLNNDQVIAEFLSRRILMGVNALIAPPVLYHYYPAFVNIQDPQHFAWKPPGI